MAAGAKADTVGEILQCVWACPPDCPSAVSCPKEVLVLSLLVLTLTRRDLRAEC